MYVLSLCINLVVICMAKAYILNNQVNNRVNNRPIIGVLAETLGESHPNASGKSFISSSYVKYLESAGTRVVPIFTNTSIDELEYIFKCINGLLLPGGDEDLMNSPYRRNAEVLWNLAMKAYDEGDYFPIWGTCLGFEALTVMVEKSDAVIETCGPGTSDVSLPMRFTKMARKSRMFRNAPEDVMEILQFENVAFNAHKNCVFVDSYLQSEKLQNYFTVLAMNRDKNGNYYLSAAEARDYPFYGVQFHPEMSIFEFKKAKEFEVKINHSENAVKMAQYFSNFFVNEARKSDHHFPDAATENKYLIYNYKPEFTGLLDDYLKEQTYIFS